MKRFCMRCSAAPYGRCVYQCDNDVVDNQVVNLLYENGVSVSMTMCAFTEHCERIINVMGSRGQIRGNMESSTLEISDFATGNHTTLHVHTPSGGHSGSDAAMMREFLQTLRSGRGSKTKRGCVRRKPPDRTGRRGKPPARRRSH